MLRIIEGTPVCLLGKRMCQGTHAKSTQFYVIPVSHPWEHHFPKKECRAGVAVQLARKLVVKLRWRLSPVFVCAVCRPRCWRIFGTIRIDALMEQEVKGEVIKKVVIFNSFQEPSGKLGWVRLVVEKCSGEHRVHRGEGRWRASQRKALFQESSGGQLSSRWQWRWFVHEGFHNLLDHPDISRIYFIISKVSLSHTLPEGVIKVISRCQHWPDSSSQQTNSWRMYDL
mmetsp:Transcript_22650/g.52280  ORF Transcript_22650/g.52280 Transcript_22650/m.52280 type:complete len:227 (+) Transcript_22650:1221-1901(+)